MKLYVLIIASMAILAFLIFLEYSRAGEINGNYLDNGDQMGENTAVKAEKLSEAYEISVDSVNELKTGFKIGYGGVSHALALAERSGKTPDEILRMKTEEKMGWGVISKELGLKPGQAYKKMDAMEQKMNRANREEKIQRKMEKAMEKAERKMKKRKGKK